MEFTFSEQVTNRLGLLTKKQKRAIPAIVKGWALGRTMTSLLTGPDKVCAWSTYYRKGRGWIHQKLFKDTLEMAMAEAEVQLLEQAVDEAGRILRRATPAAAEFEQRVIESVLTGDVEKMPPVLASLYEMATGRMIVTVEDIKGRSKEVPVLLEVKDRRQAARDVLRFTLKSVEDLLNRADVKTAIKTAGGEGNKWQELMERLHEMGAGVPRRGMMDDAELADL